MVDEPLRTFYSIRCLLKEVNFQHAHTKNPDNKKSSPFFAAFLELLQFEKINF